MMIKSVFTIGLFLICYHCIGQTNTMQNNKAGGNMYNGDDNSKHDQRKYDQRKFDQHKEYKAEIIILGDNNSTAPLKVENNYYGPADIVPDSVNFAFRYDENKNLVVWPIAGEWPTTFIAYPKWIYDEDMATTDFSWRGRYFHKRDNGLMIGQTDQANIPIKGKSYWASAIMPGKPTSAKSPYIIDTALLNKKPAFLLVGDKENENLIYIFINGNFYWYNRMR